jgi:hypothetical protein|tara:strand:+ start:6017 stop:6415 length:399 start_codon:yes stop_codon:yes gene_type:complete
MNKERAKELQVFCNTVAERFSNNARQGNLNNETFFVDEIIPTSDDSAVINFKKNTGKLAVAFCYYINRGRSKGWKYYFPTDAHVVGMQAFSYYKLEAERKNYKMNFNKEAVNQYNRNRSAEDQVTSIEDIIK